MGKGKKPASPLTPTTSNPSTQGIPRPPYSNFANYIHSYYGPMPHAWLPPFVPHPDANPYPWTSQPNIAYPFQNAISAPSGLDATSSKVVEEIKEVTPECKEVEAVCNSPLKKTNEANNDDGSPKTRQIVQTVEGDSIDEPKSGMQFTSLEELIAYYKRYARQCGFGIVTQRSERGEDESVRYVTIGCARGGKARNRTSNVVRPRPTRKTNCKAKINALKIDGMLQLTTIQNTHNHNLSPQKPQFFRYNREVSDSIKRVFDANDLDSIQMNKSFNSLDVDMSEFENLPFLKKDCRNFIENARHLRLGKGDARALREYFCKMQYKNDGFFYLMDFDDDGRLRNVFWASARSRATYKYFGDVVTFDTTYLTNRYWTPFAPFVGVNHHGQSILLGAALISSKDIETFTWLFQTWLKCMDGKAPKAIITNQDSVIKNAIAFVFPDSRHRFCLWHILNKVSKKLGSHDAYKTGLKTQLMKCVYDSQTTEEFERCWDLLITTYNLHENDWLQSLYIDRGHWVPVFLKNCFWAGMSTIQQSESMNSFLDGYVHARTNLKEFVKQFGNALKKKIENENEADLHSFNVTIPCISSSPLEKRFQDLYTNAKFSEVQQQVMGMLDCAPSLQQKDGVISTYLVEDEVRVDDFIKEVNHYVEFIEEECEVKCSCGLFEMRGILCRHILAIFKLNRVRSLPDKYILDRWRKDIKRRYNLIQSSYDVPDQWPDALRYSRLLNICYDVIKNAASCDEHTEDMVEKLYALNEVYHTNKPSHHTTLSNVEDSTINTTTAGS